MIHAVQQLRRTGILLFLLGFSVLLSESHAAEFPVDNRVLVIYGNPDIGPWEQQFNGVMLHELSTVSGIPVIPEFLSLIQTSQSQQQLIAESLRLKYSRLQIDLIIAVLPEANSFVHQWAEVFAPDAARLFVLPPAEVLSSVEQDGGAIVLQSGVEAAIRGTVQLIPQVLPDLERLFVVGGVSDGDRSYQERTERALAESDIGYEFTILAGLTPEELLARLNNAPANSAIILNPYDRDRTGEPLRAMAINTLLVENLPLPVFGAFDTLLESGTLGGNMTSSMHYANSTVELARDILAGVTLPAINFSETGFMFDGSKLLDYDIDRSLLPEDSLIVNDPPNFWRDYYGWFVTGIAIMVLQLALIAFLVETMRRRRIAESELKRVQKMEALGSLSGGIAHDFNNILMSIMANAELVKLKPGDEANVSDRVSNILSASERAKDLIAQILMFSRQSANFELKPLQLNAMLEESAGHLRVFLPGDCELNLELDEDLPSIEGDSSQLHQVIMNVCVNAQHAMDGAGSIRIKSFRNTLKQAHSASIREIPPGDYVMITISDTGSGIDKESLQHVFEPFYTTKPRGKGTGLGLALVYQIVKAHQGYIDVDSSPGRGTTVSMYFPCVSNAADNSTRSESDITFLGQQEHIVLVDDDEMVLDATSHSLRTLGYQVTAFSSSISALDWIRKHGESIDLVFSDLSMPEMDGVRLITSIREKFAQMPAVLCTGYRESIDESKLLNVAILPKPTSLKVISETIHQALSKQREVA